MNMVDSAMTTRFPEVNEFSDHQYLRIVGSYVPQLRSESETLARADLRNPGLYFGPFVFLRFFISLFVLSIPPSPQRPILPTP